MRRMASAGCARGWLERPPQEVLRTSGLFRFKEQEDDAGNKNAGRIYDYLPQADHLPYRERRRAGHCVYGPALDSDEPRKYMNSPETPLYSKGQVLFNLDKARQAIRQQNMALLVEGQNGLHGRPAWQGSRRCCDKSGRPCNHLPLHQQSLFCCRIACLPCPG